MEEAMPISTAEGSDTNPAAGVMVASPATAPVSKPTNFGFFENTQSSISQTIAANEAATSVFTNASPVTAFTSSALPALKPYQPNQSNPVPSAMRGMLFGFPSVFLLFP